MRRSGFKRPKREDYEYKPVAPRQRPHKPRGATKLPKATTVRNKADNLLTPIVRAQNPYCLLMGSQNCAKVTQVAHHHVHKSKSSRLRYDLENLIPLCGACHVMLHNDESFWGAKVAQIKGDAWFRYIEKAKHELVKTDVHFYIEAHTRLQKILAELSTK